MSAVITTTVPPLPAAPAAGMLQAVGITKSFRMGETDFTVLRELDFDLQAGEFVAIEGRSGSGKSTLLHILATLDSADAGQLLFQGSDYARRPIASGILSRLKSEGQAARLRNKQFGFIFQFYHLLPELNVVENTMLAPSIEFSWLQFRSRRSALRSRAIDLLDQLGLSHRLTHRPSQLSGGERQRVAIARALMNSPKVLFADEPTGNLDAETGRQIMDVLEKLHREHGQTIVMVTHDRSLAREADRVLVLKDGRLEQVERGNSNDETRITNQ